MNTSLGLSQPLLIPTGEARAKLESWYQKGNDLHDGVRRAYNADHFDAPIEIVVIRKFLKKTEDWFDSVSTGLKGIYANEEYVKRFISKPFDEKRFTLTPAILKKNLVHRFETSNYQSRLSKAKPAEIKQIMREIMKDIGPIDSHWNAEKGRMIANLHSRLIEGLEYLLDRMAFLGVFGQMQELMQIEFDLMDAHNTILKTFTEDPFRMTEIEDEDYYRRLFEEMEKTKTFNLETHINAKIETLRNPKHKKFEIENKQLLKIFYDGTGQMVDSISEGGPYWLNIFNERSDSIIEAKRRFSQSFQKIFNVDPSNYMAEWGSSPPKYDLKHSRYSFEELGKYGFEQLYILSCLPNIIIESRLSKRNIKTIKTKTDAAYAVRPETKRKYEGINKEIKKLGEQHPKYTYTTIFKMVADELKTTSSTVKRAYYG